MEKIKMMQELLSRGEHPFLGWAMCNLLAGEYTSLEEAIDDSRCQLRKERHESIDLALCMEGVVVQPRVITVFVDNNSIKNVNGVTIIHAWDEMGRFYYLFDRSGHYWHWHFNEFVPEKELERLILQVEHLWEFYEKKIKQLRRDGVAMAKSLLEIASKDVAQKAFAMAKKENIRITDVYHQLRISEAGWCHWGLSRSEWDVLYAEAIRYLGE